MEENDRSRRDRDVADKLVVLRLSWRVEHWLCIECGEPAGNYQSPLCSVCRQLPRYQRLLQDEGE